MTLPNVDWGHALPTFVMIQQFVTNRIFRTLKGLGAGETIFYQTLHTDLGAEPVVLSFWRGSPKDRVLLKGNDVKHVPFGVVMVFAVFSVVSAIGCASCAITDCELRNKARNLIFNPESTRIDLVDSTRSDWPATSASQIGSQTTVFRETIMDREGGRSGRSDYGRRHFTSVRTGRIRR